MIKQLRWWLATPVALLALTASVQGSAVRDEAGMFSAATVRKAEAQLTRIEQKSGVPTLIETIESLPDRPASKDARQRAIDDLAVERDRNKGARGIYILLAKEDRIMSHVLVPRWVAEHVDRDRRIAIRDAFVARFREGDFDGGLLQGVEAIDRELTAAKAEAGGPLRPGGERGRQPHGGLVPGPGPGPQARPAPAPRARGSGWGALIGIGIVILGILLVIRVLGSLFGGGARGYARPGVGPMGGGPGGYGGGYGGGGGGGFFSSLLGGIGGAMAGNWLYDRFGRHGGGYYEGPGYGAPAGTPYEGGAPDDNQIVGAGDEGGLGGSWGDSGGSGGGDWGGGGDTGGGDWGGGDAGGGDWGGGGGGGDGGGDW